MKDPNPEIEDLMKALLAGDLVPNDPEAQQLFERDARARALWEEHLATGDLLEGAALDEREVLQEARAATSAGEVDWMRAQLELVSTQVPSGVASGPSAGPTAGRNPGTSVEATVPDTALRLVVPKWILLVAASLLGVFALWYGGVFRSGDPAGGVVDDFALGAVGSFELFSPIGPASSFAQFTWEAVELPAGAMFRVVLYDAVSSADEPWHTQSFLFEPSWGPSADLLGRMPAKLIWEVQVVANGHTLDESGRWQTTLTE